ncbi:glycosyltransferase family 4 protein [Solidesulfovibrio magneticus]|uniref:Glycosyltransferase n=1 Tax=Solidesulfovibrio magneticus (strain ATCC 700980 / DSM 13731 / RS-1) TaxID=573370 RepID=C4XMP9_SOLM1|nr:glycosyltransferase family 4 protein [Solidesulfovibrio magneticus]BAH74840.1 putative glycosyltransferase [Solidesulfovibrio magneticus RS-1]
MCASPAPGFALPPPLRLAWTLRDDIRANLRLAGLAGETDFAVWWLCCGHEAFPAAAANVDIDRERLLHEVVCPGKTPDSPPITRLMDFVWRFRASETAPFNRDSTAGRAAFTAWFFSSAVPEMALWDLLSPGQQAWLHEATTPPLAPVGLPLPRLARLCWAARHDIREAFNPDTPEGTLGLLAWYVLYGAAEMGHSGDLAWRPPLPLDAPAPKLGGLSRRAVLAWTADDAARKNLDPARPEHRPAIMALVRPAAPEESGPPRRKNAPAVCLVRSGPPRHVFGVNIIGYARGELGIGEDSRMFAQSLAAADVPFAVVNVPAGAAVRQTDAWLDACLVSELPYPVSVFCLTGLDTARLWLEHGDALFAGRHNIGYWPWELPAWPACLADAYGLVDELWLSSTYTRDAFAASSPVPTFLAPMAVSVDRLTPVPRARFGLPEDRFLFLYVFDWNSYPARKNPQAAIDAFRQAFPTGREPVGLVLKTMSARPEDPRWQLLQAAAAADRRIAVLAETLDRGEALGLFAACDAYVSPHRAEGFGRTMAEAMLLGRPVIATAHSGNADFLTPDTGFPVAYRLVPVGQGDYPFGEGLLWAEPALESLAANMRLVANQPTLARRRALAGRELIAARHAPHSVGTAYRRRLQEIANLGTGRPATASIPTT